MKYQVYLNNELIGHTNLEHSDPTMGVLHGILVLNNIVSGYDFFKSYCLKNGIKLTFDEASDKLLTTADIPLLEVRLANGTALIGESGTYVEGMDSDAFYINVLGISTNH